MKDYSPLRKVLWCACTNACGKFHIWYQRDVEWLRQWVADHHMTRMYVGSQHNVHRLYFFFVWLEGHGMYSMTGGALFVLSLAAPLFNDPEV